MGNRESHKNDDFQNILHEMRKDQSRRVTISPQKKYLALMKQSLPNSKLPKTLKKLIQETLTDKVSEVQLIETVTCINALKNNEFQSGFARSQSVLKEKPESRFVKVNFGEGFLKKMLRNLKLDFNYSESTQSHPSSFSPTKHQRAPKQYASNDEMETSRKQKLMVIRQVMKKELNRIIHPFGKLNKAFAEYIEGNSHEFAPKNCAEDVYERQVQRLLADWCAYLESTCLSPYKKWIMLYTELEQNKYSNWLRNQLLMQQIWAVNNGYLFGMLATVIQRCKVPLKINIKELHESTALLTPSLFCIDSKLQIQGHFFDSIYQMSEIVAISRPEKILSQLESVKKRVCTDIDNYHRLVELGQVYEIDSDNILGIVAYILCKIASKIDEIHTHLTFLRIVYGQKVYFAMGLGSYMLSTIFGALEFLQGEHFRELLRQKRGNKHVKEVEKVGQTETKVGTSVPGQTSSIPEIGSQGESGALHTNSLLESIY